jgi:peptidoglycan L-alanyl-D-glutamate endopeptidase CwlK
MRGENIMARPNNYFQELAGVPVHYDRLGDPFGYGSRGKPHKFFATVDFQEFLEAFFSELWSICPFGPAEVICSAGAWVNKPGYHGRGKAFDLDCIHWGNKVFITKNYNKDKQFYLGVESVLRKHLPTVLNYKYNASHEDHFHIQDDGYEIVFLKGSKSATLFVQMVLTEIYQNMVEIDGIFGQETRGALESVLADLNIDKDLSQRENWLAFLTKTAERAFGEQPIFITHKSNPAELIQKLYEVLYEELTDNEARKPIESVLNLFTSHEETIKWLEGFRTAPPPPDDLAQAIANIPSAGSADWHSKFGGQKWRYDKNGVYIEKHANGEEPLRTRGEPITCRTIMELCAKEILAASQKYDVPMALIIMTIATETANYRKQGFTGPRTFRWEPHVKVNDVEPHDRGDYSAGPMQTMSTTARWVIRAQNLDYDPFEVAPHYETVPAPPEEHPLYEYKNSIDIGTAVIKQRCDKTGDDPILVAAAYNAGGIYESQQNDWKLRSTGDHLDRAARWYGDALAVLKEIKS